MKGLRGRKCVCCVYAYTPGNSVRDDGVYEKMEAGTEGTVLAQKNKIGVR